MGELPDPPPPLVFTSPLRQVLQDELSHCLLPRLHLKVLGGRCYNTTSIVKFIANPPSIQTPPRNAQALPLRRR